MAIDPVGCPPIRSALPSLSRASPSAVRRSGRPNRRSNDRYALFYPEGVGIGRPASSRSHDIPRRIAILIDTPAFSLTTLDKDCRQEEECLRLPQYIVSADTAEEIRVSGNVEREAIVLCDPSLPDIAGIFHLLDTQRRMTRVLKEETELFFCTLLDCGRKACKVPVKRRGCLDGHSRDFFRGVLLPRRCRINASTVLNGRDISPRRIA